MRNQWILIHHQRQNPNIILLLAEGLPLFFRDIKESNIPRGWWWYIKKWC